jgi:hypothetical protein
MKIIPLGKVGILDTKPFLIQMIESSPAGQTIGQMRERLAVLKALKACPDDATDVSLEDAQHNTLVGVINERRDFAVTSEDIVAVVDAVIAAKAPDKAD